MPLPKARAGRAAVSEVFADLEPLVRRIVKRFCKKYRCEFEETYAEACYHFLCAYHTHNPEKGILETRVQFVVWNRLLDRTRRDAVEAVRLPRAVSRVYYSTSQDYSDGEQSGRLSRSDTAPYVEHLGESDPDPFDADALELTETDDARFLLGLLLDTPGELAHAIRSDPKPGERSTKDHLKRHLAGLGWDRDRITAAFAGAEETVAAI